MTESGLQFDTRAWVCLKTFGRLSCKMVCIDYPTLKEHQATRCKVMKVKTAVLQKRERIQREHLAQETGGTLDEWGLRA